MISTKARDSKNFVAMMQFVDWLWYSDAGQEFAKWGVEGTTYTKDASDDAHARPDVDFVGLNPTGTKHLQKDFGFHQRRASPTAAAHDLIRGLFSRRS